MSKSEEVQRYIAICHRYKMMGKITKIAVIAVSAVAFIGGMAGIIRSAVNEDYSSFSFYVVMGVVFPIVLLIGYVIWLATSDIKRHNKFLANLYDSNLSADEVLQIGEKAGMNLFSVAADIRCKKELKMKGVPEWCARDGVLPDKN